MSADCARVMDGLGAPLPPELAAHAAGCPDCRPLLEGFDALGALAPQAPTPALEAARACALEELAAHPRATPWTQDAWRLGALYVGLAGLATGVFAWKGALLNQASPSVVAGLAGVVLLALGGGIWLALAPARRLAWGGVLAGVLGVAVLVLLGRSGLVTRGFLTGCVPCVRTSLLLSAVPLMAGMGLLRQIAFHAVRAVAVGLAAGAVGLLVLHLHCPEGGAAHLLASHLGPWLLLGALAPAVRLLLRTTRHAP